MISNYGDLQKMYEERHSDNIDQKKIDKSEDDALKAFKVRIGEQEEIIITSYHKFEQIRSQIQAKHEKEIKASLLLTDSQRRDLEKKNQQIRENNLKAEQEAEQKVLSILAEYEKNLYKTSSLDKKKELKALEQKAYQDRLKQIDSEKAYELARAEETNTSKEDIEAKYRAMREEVQQKEVEAENDLFKLKEKHIATIIKRNGEVRSRSRLSPEDRAEMLLSGAKRLRGHANDLMEEMSNTKDKDLRKSLRKQAVAASRQASLAEAQAVLMKTVSNTLKSIDKKMDKAVDAAVEIVNTYRTQFDSRLQGYSNFNDVFKTVRRNLAVNPFLSQKSLLEHMKRFVDAGAVYNIEQRAFLDAMAEKVVTTFDALDTSLQRIIRIQQADSTAARMGIEASLTKFFNGRFRDSSYLSGLSDSVTAAILDASVQLDRNSSAEFEYTVQKWLGSMYSVGVSDAFVSSLAGGLNMLGTGNVQGLSGNEAMQSLFALALSRSKTTSIDNILENGLTASSTNELMKNIVEYLQEIANNTDSQVVKAAYGDIFGFSVADLRAMQNLSGEDIKMISDSMLKYTNAIGEAQYQIDSIYKRMTLPQMMENMFDNLMLSFGSRIANNPAMYAIWKVANMIDEAGGIHLPAVSVMGNMVDLSSFTVEGIMRGGVVGASSLGLIGDLISSLGGEKSGKLLGLSLSDWGADEYVTRGKGFGYRGGGKVNINQSSSAYVGSHSSKDFKDSALAGATEEAENTSKTTNKNVKSEKTFDDMYKTLFEDKKPIDVHIVNERVNTNLNNVSDKAQSYIDKKIEAIIKSILSTSLRGQGDEEFVLPVSLKNSDATVTITNSDIEDFLKRYAFFASE